MAGTGQNAPEPRDESAQWAALAKELETPDPILDAPPDQGPGDKTPSRTPEPPIQRHEDIRTPQPPKEDDAPEPDDQTPRPKLTYEQLESNNRNTTEALRQAREQQKRAEDNLQKLLERIASREPLQPQARAEPRPEPPKIPDVSEDPIGHFDARQQRL